MGKSGHDVISSSSLISYSLFHLALTYQFAVPFKLEERFSQTMAYQINLLTTTPRIGGKTGINAKTKVPSHILHT